MWCYVYFNTLPHPPLLSPKKKKKKKKATDALQLLPSREPGIWDCLRSGFDPKVAEAMSCDFFANPQKVLQFCSCLNGILSPPHSEERQGRELPAVPAVPARLLPQEEGHVPTPATAGTHLPAAASESPGDSGSQAQSGQRIVGNNNKSLLSEAI